MGNPLAPMRRLVYLSYGGKDVHVAETKYAILSASRHIQPADAIGILLYTDRPNLYSDLPVEIRAISGLELEAWTGPGGYQYRRKAEVVKDALALTESPIAFIDSDTWFIKSPVTLFDRIGPGRSVLHVDEGPIGTSGYGPNIALAEHLADHDYATAKLDGESRVWNSGVIGLHPSDAGLIDQAISLIDRIWNAFPKVDTLEQFAVSHYFAAHTSVSPAVDVVFHYWPLPLRKPFHEVIVEAMKQLDGCPPAERAKSLHSLRPRLRGVKRLRHGVKALYRATGNQWPNSIPGNAT